MRQAPLYLILLWFLFPACTSYQVYQTQSGEDIKTKDHLYIYENEVISIVYDFWAEAGVLVLRISNESKETLVLDFEHSHFLINREKLPYFNEAMERYSLLLPPVDQATHRLDPGEYIDIEGYPVPFEWRKIPKKQSQLSFDPGSTPLTIGNQLSYIFEKERYTVNNNFWISQISSIGSEEFRSLNKPWAANADKFYLKKDNTDLTLGILRVSLAVLEIAITTANN